MQQYLTETRTDGALDLLLSRRSAGRLVDPAPTAEQFDALIEAAASVPDHGRLQPWRFVVIDGDARDRFADALEAGAREADPTNDPGRLAKARGKAYVAPAAIAVVAAYRSGTKVPEWEQTASAACAGYAITLAAHAMGIGAVWKSVPFVESPSMRECFGLGEGERLLGWINVGREVADDSTRPPNEPRPDRTTYLAA